MLVKVADMVKQMRKTEGLNKSKPFSIVFVTADRNRKSGGHIRELHHCILLTKQRSPKRILNLQPLGINKPVAVHLDLILYFNGDPVA